MGGGAGRRLARRSQWARGRPFVLCVRRCGKKSLGPPAANLHAAMESLDGSPPLAVATEGKNNIGPQGMVGIAPSP